MGRVWFVLTRVDQVDLLRAGFLCGARCVVELDEAGFDRVDWAFVAEV